MSQKVKNYQRCAVYLRITGQVQGVGYRKWAIGKADDLSLDGWIKNNSDGSVEVVAAGFYNAIKLFIESCYVGPESATVRSIEEIPVSVQDTPLLKTGFRQKVIND